VLSRQGYRVLAFDISPSAIAMCRQRYPDSTVDYRVADLFKLPAEWRRGFDLVYECNTIQILTGPARALAIEAIADLVADGGDILVSCRSRDKDAPLDSFRSRSIGRRSTAFGEPVWPRHAFLPMTMSRTRRCHTSLRSINALLAHHKSPGQLRLVRW
jgi:SAM-dependent methyltransferase